jgi:hypothetical protein
MNQIVERMLRYTVGTQTLRQGVWKNSPQVTGSLASFLFIYFGRPRRLHNLMLIYLFIYFWKMHSGISSILGTCNSKGLQLKLL